MCARARLSRTKLRVDLTVCPCGNAIDRRRCARLCGNCYAKENRRERDPLVGTRPRNNQPIRKSLVGETFGRLAVLSPIKGSRAGRRLRYLCQCVCGRQKWVDASNLKNGCSRSCGCLKTELLSLRPFESLYNHAVRINKNRRPFELSYEEFMAFMREEKCHYCKGPILREPYPTKKPGNKHITYTGYYLDRKNPKIGYVRTNCVSCCTSCNWLKSDKFTHEEFVLLGDVLHFLRHPPSFQESAFIHTFSGKRWRVECPNPEDVDIVDIAHSLSLMCRFNGSVRKFYSIAEHSVRVSQICSPENQLWGLLHDSGEFATEDMNRPLKYSPGMGVYRLYERKTQAAIMQHFGQPTEEPAEVKAADRRLLVTEQRDLMVKGEISPGSFRESYAEILPLEETIIPWTSKKAEREFLARFRALTAPAALR